MSLASRTIETVLIRKYYLLPTLLVFIILADGGPSPISILYETSSPGPFILTIVTYSLQKSVTSRTEIWWDHLLEKSGNTTYDCLRRSLPFPLWKEISDELREISIHVWLSVLIWSQSLKPVWAPASMVRVLMGKIRFSVGDKTRHVLVIFPFNLYFNHSSLLWVEIDISTS